MYVSVPHIISARQIQPQEIAHGKLRAENEALREQLHDTVKKLAAQSAAAGGPRPFIYSRILIFLDRVVEGPIAVLTALSV